MSVNANDQTAVNTPNQTPFMPYPPHLPLTLRAPGQTAPVRVACHRGDWRNFVENTLEAVESCIEMGADIVEVDLRRTSDGHFVLMHDETLDRTTTGHGRVSSYTLNEIKGLRLKDGLGNATEFVVPTLEEVLQLAKDRVVVNLDKAVLYFDQLVPILERNGMLGQTILKSDIPYTKLLATFGEKLLNRIIFMPIINITEQTTEADIIEIFKPHHGLYEVNFEVERLELLHLIHTRAKADGAVLWYNTIWPTLCSGHSDDHALKDAEGTWGYIVELGAGILQTDRPQRMLQYLRSRGDREE